MRGASKHLWGSQLHTLRGWSRVGATHQWELGVIRAHETWRSRQLHDNAPHSPFPLMPLLLPTICSRIVGTLNTYPLATFCQGFLWAPYPVPTSLGLESLDMGSKAPIKSIGASWGPAVAQPCLQPPSELAREYVCIKYVASNYIGMDTVIQNRLDGHFNYVDLNLISPLEASGHAWGPSTYHPHSYTQIECQNFREAKVRACPF